jgi:hypothetical protein
MDDQEVDLWATAPRYFGAHLDVRVDGGTQRPAEAVLRLEPGAALVGVVRSADGRPVAGAVVRAVLGLRGRTRSVPLQAYESDQRWEDRAPSWDEARALSGPDGGWRIDGVATQEAYRVAARAVGHGASEEVVVRPQGETQVDLPLRRPARVLARLVVPEGVAVGEPRVRLFQDWRMHAPAGRDAGGQYRFDDVDPGPAVVFAGGERLAPVTTSVDLAEGATERVELVLDAGGAVEGVVHDGGGKPVVAAWVKAEPADDAPFRDRPAQRQVRTDEEGRFAIRGLRSKRVQLSAHGTDAATGRVHETKEAVGVSVPARDVLLVLARRPRVRVRLMRPDRTPFVGTVFVELSHSAGHGSVASQSTTDGILTDDTSGDGSYEWLLNPEGFAWFRRTFDVREGADVDLGDVVLDPGLVVWGTVLDAARRPVDGVAIGVAQNERRGTRTDAHGAFRLDRIPRERVTLFFEADGFVSTRLLVEPSRTTGLDVRLQRFASVELVLRTASGVLVSDGEFDLRRGEASGDDDLRLRAGVEGQVPPGPWIGFWTDASGTVHRLGEWTFTDGERRRLEVVLPSTK